MSRYHPFLVLLHWLLAVLIVAMLCVGFFLAAAMPDTDPQKTGILMWHMSTGMLILALMAVRFIVRLWTTRPADAATGRPVLDRIAPVTHYGFYILVLAMSGTGFATAILAGLNRSVFQGSGEPLPPSFTIYPTLWRTSILRCSLPDSSSCIFLRRSIISPPEKTDCCSGCCSGDVFQVALLLQINSPGLSYLNHLRILAQNKPARPA